MSFLKTNTTTKSQKITQFESTVCDFSTGVPLLYGTSKLGSNLICYQDFEAKKVKKTVKTGKSKSTSITYKYYVYAELALGEGVIDGIGKIWIGDDKYNSLSALNTKEVEGSGLTLNRGNITTPTAYMQTKHSDIAVGYDNLAYCYGTIYLGQDNASMPSYNFETLGTLRGADVLGDTKDANVAYVIRDMLERIGLDDYIDEESFNNYALYCYCADWLVSTPDSKFSSQQKAQSYIEELLTLTNTYMIWSVNKFKFIPRDDRTHSKGDKVWIPNKTVRYDLDLDDMSVTNGGVVTFSRKDASERYNRITVNFLNRSNEYESESVSYENVSDVQANGLRETTYDATWLHTKARAVAYAEMKARMAFTERVQYQFTLDWAFCRLEVGDLLRISDSNLDLQNKVVMISEITETVDGLLNITAIAREDGEYSAAEYTVTDEYQYIDLNVEPSPTSTPIFITPPADLTTSSTGVELWIALKGNNSSWGGCMVYGAGSDDVYILDGEQNNSATVGTTLTDLSANGDSVTVQLTNHEIVQLITGSALSASSGNTKVWINGEVLSYTESEYLGNNQYRLSGLLRGENNTESQNHTTGSAFVVLDSSLYVVYLQKEHIGKTLKFKFPAFNQRHKNAQELEDCVEYQVLISAYDLPNVSNVTATTRYADTYGAGYYPRYDIVVKWDLPTFATYAGCEVMYKCSSTSTVFAADGQTITDATLEGMSADWQSAGFSTADTLTIPQCNIGDTYKIAVCVRDIYGFQELPDSSSQVTVVVATKTEIPNTPSNLQITFKETPILSWDFVTNADVRYYEVWSDTGRTGTLLARTNGNSASLPLTERTGTVYLTAVSVYGKYSTEASLSYTKNAPAQPSAPVIYELLDGLKIDMQGVPTGSIGIHLYIDDLCIESGTTYSYNCPAGNYSVKYCFYDCFGEGVMSAETVAEVSVTIDQKYLENITITQENLDASLKNTLELINNQASINETIQNAINTNATNIISLRGDLTNLGTQVSTNEDAISLLATRVDENESGIAEVKVTANGLSSRVAVAEGNITNNTSLINQTANSISTVVSNLKNNNVSEYTAFTQLENAIGLCAKSTDILTGDELVAAINLGSGTVKIDGKLIEITGNTVFNENAIIKGTMQAGSIQCDKGVSITGGAVTINKNGLTVKKSDNSRVAYNANGVQFLNANGNVYSTLGATCIGTAGHGKKVTFNVPFNKAPTVICTPSNLKTSTVGYTSSDLTIVCNATGITKNGFTVNCYSQLAAGAKAINNIPTYVSNACYKGMTDDYRNLYNASTGARTPSTYPCVTVTENGTFNYKTDKLGANSHIITKSFTKPKGTSNVSISFSWKGVPSYNGSVFPIVYIRNTATGANLATYSGYTQTSSYGAVYLGTDGTEAGNEVWVRGSDYGEDRATISADLDANTTTFYVVIELCYRRYHNSEDATYLKSFVIDSYTLTTSTAVTVATGTASFIALESSPTYTVS